MIAFYFISLNTFENDIELNLRKESLNVPACKLHVLPILSEEGFRKAWRGKRKL
jgi:hypothetical protein